MCVCVCVYDGRTSGYYEKNSLLHWKLKGTILETLVRQPSTEEGSLNCWTQQIHLGSICKKSNKQAVLFGMCCKHMVWNTSHMEAGLEEKSMEEFTSLLISTPRATPAVSLPLQRGPWNGSKNFSRVPFSTSDTLSRSPLLTSGEVHFPSRAQKVDRMFCTLKFLIYISLTPSQSTQKINPRNTKQQKSWFSGIQGCLVAPYRGQELQLTHWVRYTHFTKSQRQNEPSGILKGPSKPQVNCMLCGVSQQRLESTMGKYTCSSKAFV